MGRPVDEEVIGMDRKLAVVAGASMSAAAFGVLFKAMGAPPNVEALMAFIMPAAMVLGPFYGFTNALLTRAVYDAYQGWAGWWTVLTSLSYGLVGLAAGYVMRYKKAWNRVELAGLAAVLTLFYDVITMLAFGVPFGIPLAALVAGQVPFTINHVVGNVLLCFAFAPLLLKALSGYVGVKVESRQPVVAAVPSQEQ